VSRTPLLALTAAALAALSLGLAACGGSDSTSAATTAPATTTAAPAVTAPAGTAPAATATVVEVAADPGGSLAFTKTTLTAPAGPVTLKLTNDSPVPHNIAVKGSGVDSPPSDTIQGGDSAELKVDLPAGSYEYYCEVPGHEAAGMKGTITVK
jgi:nitrite reductase (NO-forming)